MTQPFVALKANAAANATDLGGGLFQTTLTVSDDSSVYTGLDVAAGFKLVKGQNGGQMRIYDIVSVDSAFASQITITVDDTDIVGTPGFGDAAIVQANAAGIFPVPAGIDQGVQQAITQYNLQFSGGSSGGALITYETPAPVTGSVISVPGIVATSIIYNIYLDNTALYPSEFSLQAGQITLLGLPADDSNLLIRFV